MLRFDWPDAFPVLNFGNVELIYFTLKIRTIMVRACQSESTEQKSPQPDSGGCE